MNKEEFYELLGDVKPEYIEEATAVKVKKNRLKLLATAACICLAALALPLIIFSAAHKGSILFPDKNGSFGCDDIVPEPNFIEYNSAYYEYITDQRILKKFGLPTTVTAKHAGRHIAYIEKFEGELRESLTPTDMELLEYAPFPCEGVMIFRSGKNYYAAVFDNHLNYGEGVRTPIDKLFKLYGVTDAADIRSISKYDDTPLGNGISHTVNDRDEISAFFSAALGMTEAYTDSEFDTIQFIGSEESRMEQYISFADNYTQLRIETSHGIVFYLTVFPKYGWMEGDLTHYKFNDEMKAWFERNF